MQVIVINGQSGVGKDCFAAACKQLLGDRCLNISSIDYVKLVAKTLGWDGVKTPESRKFLSDLKDVLTTCPWGDLPYEDVISRINIYQDLMAENSNCLVFVHIREPEYIDKLVKSISAKTLLIRRPEVEGERSNHADANVFDYQYDYEIVNDGTIGDLALKAEEFLERIGLL